MAANSGSAIDDNLPARCA